MYIADKESFIFIRLLIKLYRCLHYLYIYLTYNRYTFIRCIRSSNIILNNNTDFNIKFSDVTF